MGRGGAGVVDPATIRPGLWCLCTCSPFFVWFWFWFLPSSWALMRMCKECARFQGLVCPALCEHLHSVQLSACLCVCVGAQSDCQVSCTAASGLVDCRGLAVLPTSVGSLALFQSLLLQGEGMSGQRVDVPYPVILPLWWVGTGPQA